MLYAERLSTVYQPFIFWSWYKAEDSEAPSNSLNDVLQELHSLNKNLLSFWTGTG